MGALTDFSDGIFGGANQAADLGIGQFRVMFDQPSNCIRLVTTPGNRHITRTLGAGCRLR